MSGRRDDGSAEKREMVTLVDPDGVEFETGDLATLHSLRAQGYALKGRQTYSEAVEKLEAKPAATPPSAPSK